MQSYEIRAPFYFHAYATSSAHKEAGKFSYHWKIQQLKTNSSIDSTIRLKITLTSAITTATIVYITYQSTCKNNTPLRYFALFLFGVQHTMSEPNSQSSWQVSLVGNKPTKTTIQLGNIITHSNNLLLPNRVKCTRLACNTNTQISLVHALTTIKA